LHQLRSQERTAHSRGRKARRRELGQSLVEFTLVLPVLLLLVLFGVDFGRLFYGWVTLTNATRVAANYAATYPNAADGFGSTSTYAKLVKNDITNLGGICPVPTISPPVFSPDTNLASTASVTLTCRFNALTPIVGSVVGSNLPVSQTSVFVIRTGFAAP